MRPHVAQGNPAHRSTTSPSPAVARSASSLPASASGSSTGPSFLSSCSGSHDVRPPRLAAVDGRLDPPVPARRRRPAAGAADLGG
eukprot:4165366-Alexandrium_andersonii.AAC.1